jgi:hypothetical protein
VSECAIGPVRESEVHPERPQVKKITNAPNNPIRLLPGDSAPLGVITTAATRGGEGSHSRGGGGTGPQGHIPLKIKNPEGETRLDHGPKSPPWRTTEHKLAVKSLTRRHMRTNVLCSAFCCFPWRGSFESRVLIENWKWVSKGCGSYLIHPGKPWVFPPL